MVSKKTKYTFDRMGCGCFLDMETHGEAFDHASADECIIHLKNELDRRDEEMKVYAEQTDSRIKLVEKRMHGESWDKGFEMGWRRAWDHHAISVLQNIKAATAGQESEKNSDG